MKQSVLIKLRDQVLRRAYWNASIQARYRGQEWQLTMDEFIDLWSENDSWAERGRRAHNLTLSRIDMDGDWNINNVEIITRSEMLKREGKHRSQKKCK